MVIIVLCRKHTEYEFLVVVDTGTDKNLTNTECAYPYPYRIEGTTLLDSRDELNEVYHNDTPFEVDRRSELQKYALENTDNPVPKEVEINPCRMTWRWSGLWFSFN